MTEFCVHEKHGGICKKTNSYCNLGACPYEDLKEFVPVKAVPAVDAVEVVRCKDCEHFKLFSDGYIKCKHRYGLAQITLDSFCSRGERKEI